jgi:vesicle-fusing ATPase
MPSLVLTADKTAQGDRAVALTNKVYLNPADLAALTSESGPILTESKGFVYFAEPDTRIPKSKLGFNSLQREAALITLAEQVTIAPFNLPLAPVAAAKLAIEPIPKPPASASALEVADDKFVAAFKQNFQDHVLQPRQQLAMDFEAKLYRVTVISVCLVDLDASAGKVPSVGPTRGVLLTTSDLELSAGESVHILSNGGRAKQLFNPSFNFESFGVGGLGGELATMFRRVFASRMLPNKIVRQWGMNHIRGMLLYGPPGTGKTLIARQLAKFVNAREPKIVNGPEILDKYVGGSEQKIRELFADAEKEQKQQGADNSQLHIIILDELDAICKQRGSTRDGTGVHDSIVNQLLSKIDGVDSLNNILLIGMTNRIDLIDEALLRPGRLEVHVEISLPNEQGRLEILNIHTKKIRENSKLADDVDLRYVARHSKNFSGAELEGLVRLARSYAFDTVINFAKVAGTGVGAAPDLDTVKLSQTDFVRALAEMKPAFGANEEDMQSKYIRYGIIRWSHKVDELVGGVGRLVANASIVRPDGASVSDITSVLFYGADNSGRTALACHAAIAAGIPFIRIISADSLLGLSEATKVSQITKTFEDAYKSPASAIIVDDIERIVEYSSIGPRFSNALVQALLILIKKPHPKSGRKLVLLGTCSTTFRDTAMDELGLVAAFDEVHAVPLVDNVKQAEIVLRSVMKKATSEQVTAIARLAIAGPNGAPVKKLIKYAEMAAIDLETDDTV